LKRRWFTTLVAVPLCLITSLVLAPAAHAASCSGTDWSGDYFANMTLAGTPTLSRCDPAINFNWQGAAPGAGVPPNQFSTRWTRSSVFTAGSYAFTATGDDGIRVYLDGTMVLDGWRDQGATTYNANASVTAGTHTVVVEYYQNAYDAVAQFSYAPAGTPSTANLVANPDLVTGSPLPTCFSDGGWGQSSITSGFSSDMPTGITGRSWRIDIANYVNGDEKLMPSDAAGCVGTVDPSKQYTVGLYYKSTNPDLSIPLFTYKAGSGWSYWTILTSLPATTTWTRVSQALPPLPAGTSRVSFGVASGGNGSLWSTDFSLTSLSVSGRWTTASVTSPVHAMHSTLLRDGRVLMIAGSGNDANNFAAGTFSTSVWNPVTNTFLTVPTPSDMFCSGHVTLPDGRVLIQGGTSAYATSTQNYKGLKSSYIFDPSTNSFTRTSDAQQGHWYPTLTKLENGNVWMAGGYSDTGNGAVSTEMFNFTQNRWLGASEVPQTYEDWGTYPHMFLLADGRLFYDGGHTFGGARPGTGATIYDWRAKTVGDVPGLRDPGLRDQAGSVLLPPAQNQTFMIAGGGSVTNNLPPTNKVDIINMNNPSPSYVPGPDLPGGARLYLNLTNLPDRTVLASNGSTMARGGDLIAASIYNPAANAWTTVPADPVGRDYHSSSLLLPDGRVVVMGSNPADGSWDTTISIYEPPYLFKGVRPTIASAPTDTTYGASFNLGVNGTVVTASLTSPGSATHQTDTNSRLIDLPITGTGSARTATVPTNPALIPPGPYMLTVLDDKGAVSTASWVNIR